MIRLVLAISMVLVLLAPATVQAQNEVCAQILPYPEPRAGELVPNAGKPFVKASTTDLFNPPFTLSAVAVYRFRNVRITEATVEVRDYVLVKREPVLLEVGAYYDDGVTLHFGLPPDRMYLPMRVHWVWTGKVFLPKRGASNIINTIIVRAQAHPVVGPPGTYIGVALREVCFLQEDYTTPTPLFISTPIFIPGIQTPTQAITATGSVTPTRTLTFTPVTHTATASPPTSPTLSASGTVPSSRTPISTLPSVPVPSPVVPPNACTDPNSPCGLFPKPIFPTVALVTPTRVSTVNYTLSPLPSMTAAGAPSGQTTAVAMELVEVATQVGLLRAEQGMEATRILRDTQGMPVDVANAAYTLGSRIGGFFGIVRQFSEHGTGLGRTGGILVVIIALIAFNLLIRLLLFAVPIVKTILELLGTVIRTVIGLIKPL